MRTLIAWLRARCAGVRGAVATLTLLGAVAAGVTAQCLVTDSLAVVRDQETNAADTQEIALDGGLDSAKFVVTDSPAVFTDQETDGANKGDVARDDGADSTEFAVTDSPAVLTDPETTPANGGDIAPDAESVVTDPVVVFTD